jgi:hypothetical protein
VHSGSLTIRRSLRRASRAAPFAFCFFPRVRFIPRLVVLSAPRGALGGCCASPANPSRACACGLSVRAGPFVKLPKSLPPADGPDALQRPFPCSEFAARGLGGIAFNVLNRTSPRHTELCALAAAPGTQCTFNELVDLLRRSDDPASPTHRMTLAALGGLLFTPRRVKLGVSSDPVLENKVVIVRKRSDDSVLTTRAGVRAAWEAAWKPFSTEAWKLCFGATAALLSFIGLVSCCRPTPVALSGNWPRKQFATVRCQRSPRKAWHCVVATTGS